VIIKNKNTNDMRSYFLIYVRLQLYHLIITATSEYGCKGYT